MRSSLRIDPWNDLSSVPFSGSTFYIAQGAQSRSRQKASAVQAGAVLLRFAIENARSQRTSGITGGATLDCPAAVGGPDAHSRKLGAGAPPTPDGDLPPQHRNLGAVIAASFPHEDETSELSDFATQNIE